MKAIRGHVIDAPVFGSLRCVPNGTVVLDDGGAVLGVFAPGALPEAYRPLPVEDLGDKLLIPAFTDLHLHSSQAPIQGLGQNPGDNWFAEVCYPAEKRYADLAYADKLNRDLVRALWEQGTMHANIMCTVSTEAALNLFGHYAASGMAAAIGKMNSDYGAFGEALESTEQSMEGTRRFVEQTLGQSALVRPALAPEFAPACTAETMGFLGRLAAEKGLIVHSHMCEGDFDNDMVARRFPEQRLYSRVYDQYGLFGQTPTAMAHCLTAGPEDIALMAERGVMLAHCPNSILNDPQGGRLLPVRRLLEAGVPVGLGSDIGGAHTLSIPQNMLAAMQVSKLAKGGAALSLAEAFYLGTKGGGALFGRVGSFEAGCSFDALVVDDARWNRHAAYTLEERLTRFIYCGDSRDIQRRFCAGAEVFCPG